MSIQTLDLITAFFETGGAIAIWGNVVRILRDKKMRGVSPFATAFFAVWGLWNLVLFSYLEMWYAFGAGAALVSGNLTWIALMWRYRHA